MIPDTQQQQGMMMIALAADVQKVASVMKELETLEGILEHESQNDEEVATTSASGRAIEVKAHIKKLMTHPDTMESLDRLEVQGEPVWGLSTDERELIMLAREKVNEC